MAYINYYIDKPYNSEVSKLELRKIIRRCNAQGKQYPKSILNPRPTAIYLFMTYEKNKRIKIKTLFKTLAYDWDFKNGCLRNKAIAAFDTNNELQSLSSQILKQYGRLKEDNKHITEPEIRSLIENTIHKVIIKKENSLKKATELFLEKKKGILSEGTLKEYRTIFKSLTDYELHTGKVLSFNDFNQAFFNEYERFLILKKNPYAVERGLFNDTISKYCSTLKTFLDWCFYEGFLKSRELILNIKTQIKRKLKNDIIALSESEYFNYCNLIFPLISDWKK